MLKSSRSLNSSKSQNEASPNNPDLAPLGVIAGWGEFPLLVAKTARQQGRKMIAVAFPGETDPGLSKLVDEIHWVRLGQLGKMIKVFQKAQVREAVMAGSIRHKQLFANLRLDWRALRLLTQLKDKRADSLLRGVAQVLEQAGICLVSPLPWLKDYLPQKGILTRRKPTVQEQKDIAFGYRIAKHIASADIGQTVVVKNQAVIAVEAMEGTDACILRSGEYLKSGAVVVKVTKPSQDLRFDTPILGPQTIQILKKVRVAVLAFDAGHTLVLQRERTLAEADCAKISVVVL